MFGELFFWLLLGLGWAVFGRRRGWGCGLRPEGRVREFGPPAKYRGEGAPPETVRRAARRGALPRPKVEASPEEALRREFVSGRLTVDEYERGLDRLLGLEAPGEGPSPR